MSCNSAWYLRFNSVDRGWGGGKGGGDEGGVFSFFDSSRNGSVPGRKGT